MIFIEDFGRFLDDNRIKIDHFWSILGRFLAKIEAGRPKWSILIDFDQSIDLDFEEKS